MDSIQEFLSAGKPVLIASSKDGRLVVRIDLKVYEYWIDAALHPWIRKMFTKNPWVALNFILKRSK
jgi:hypothetical protein